MPKPMTEHSTTFKPAKGAAKPTRRSELLEPVGGGRVRRVEFNEGPRTETRTVTEAPQRSDDTLDHIHFEVDNLHRIRKGAQPRARAPRETPLTKRVFETDSGAVKSSRQPTSDGDKRVLYTSRRKGAMEEETRFHSGMVDRIIAEKYRDGPQWETGDAPPKKGLFGRKTSTEVVDAEIVKNSRDGRKARRARQKADKAEKEYQPQCTAVTKDGLQCRNSAKDGSDHCGSHQDYTPRSIEDLLDTEPARGEDTLPGEGDKTGTGQCAAYTKEGLQCRRNSRKNSKYCSTHKGYRPPSKESLAKRMDTLPRHAGAKDTAPDVR